MTIGRQYQTPYERDADTSYDPNVDTSYDPNVDTSYDPSTDTNSPATEVEVVEAVPGAGEGYETPRDGEHGDDVVDLPLAGNESDPLFAEETDRAPESDRLGETDRFEGTDHAVTDHAAVTDALEESNRVDDVSVADGSVADATPGGTHTLSNEWQSLQGRFVDDPDAAVTDAAALVDETARFLLESLREQASGGPDTEQKRLAFQRYRAVHEALTRV